jgi:hypothetical protein
MLTARQPMDSIEKYGWQGKFVEKDGGIPE